MERKIKILKMVLLIILSTILIVAPIVVRKMIDLKKELANSIGYRYILEIEKRNLSHENPIKDGKNIDTKKIKTNIKATINGKVTIENKLVTSARLVINGYKFDYYKSNNSSDNDIIIYRYYIDDNSILDEISPKWKAYFKENINNITSKENTSHILSYKYKNKKYSLIMDDKKECEISLKELTKISDYKELSCKIRYDDKNLKKELCIVIDENNTMCQDLDTWNNLSEIKKNFEKIYSENITCDTKSKQLICKINENIDLHINEKKEIKINDTKCKIYSDQKVECS